MNRKTITLAAAALAALMLVGATVGVAVATGPTGTITRTNLTAFPPGSALAPTGLINADRIKFESKDDATVVFQQAVYEPGADSGWHLHQGVVFVAVVGAPGARVTRSVGCGSKVYGAGQTFIESGEQAAGKITNSGAIEVTLYVMYIVPMGHALSDPTAPAPSC